MNETVFYLIPKYEVTREMIAASNSEAITEMPTRVIGPITYCILEVPLRNVGREFDGYSQYTWNGASKLTPPPHTNRILVFTPFKGAALAQQETTFSHVFQETLEIKEVILKSLSASFGDEVTLESYSGQDLVSSLVVGMCVSTDLLRLVPPSKLVVPAGIETRLRYKNVGASPTNIFMTFVCRRL